MFYIVFCSKSSKTDVYFMLIAHLNSDTQFSWEIPDLYFHFIKCTAEKVDSLNQVVPNILRNFLTTELFVSKFTIQVLICTSHISSAQQPHVAR